MGAAVLLVDDERFARTLYSDYLCVAGYDVQVADTADAALAALRQRKFDLLITDIVLPGADGLELLTEAKRLDPDMEALVITALDRVDPAVRAMKSGASDYLVKPVTPEALQLAVQKCLSARALLAENKALRSHIQLFETCQRITSSLDHDRAIALALDAVSQELSAEGALFLEQSSQDELVRAGEVGLSPEVALSLASASAPAVAAAGGAIAELALPPGSPTPSAVVLRVAEGEALLGAVVALVKARPGAAEQTSAGFVCSHLALALRTLGHLRQVEHLAYLDDLTHLYNTRFLEIVLDREMEGGNPFSVLFLDLDRFKSVNDHHGHVLGSKLLIEVGRVLKSCVRDEDVVARYGGDEYVAVLLGIDSGGALKVAERIRRSVEDHVFLSREGARVRITVSIGLASFPEHATRKSEVLDLADRAMYRGKRSTRNVVYIASRDMPLAEGR
ncbi:MAG TPA: diguanylate cyclase [Anaeromyxobacteraceae bacterium]|nr:diguanylate cyclase [Anaeromyxobacteraceae bacterium]